MIRNGYKIKLQKGQSVNDYISALRSEMKEKTVDIAKALVARDIELLWDTKFIETCEFDKSIAELAIARVNEKMMGISNGMLFDGRYDLRSTINIVKITDEEITVLFNTSNVELHNYFESIPEVSSYKYYAEGIEEDISEEENNKRGLFWQNEFEKCGWKTTLLGLSAQITLQPNLEEIMFDAAEFKTYFRTKEERMEEFIKSRIVIDRVRLMLGNAPIDKVAPIALEEMFREAYAYLDSKDGQKDYKKNVEKIGSGFIPIDTSMLTLK